jgi:hypothetical protein
MQNAKALFMNIVELEFCDFAVTEFFEVQSRIMHRLPLRAARMASKRA